MAIVHWTIFADNESDREQLFEQLLLGQDLPKELEYLKGMKGGLFSQSEIDRFIEEEERHDLNFLTAGSRQHLNTLSSGERKKALLEYLLSQDNEFLVLDNPLDNLDTASREVLRGLLSKLARDIPLVQLITRKTDQFSFPSRWAVFHEDKLRVIDNLSYLETITNTAPFKKSVPGPLNPIAQVSDPLVLFKKVSLSYGEKPVLHQVSWELKSGEFWQLSGPNGSGKTTMLSLITGENPKAYGQDISLFGNKKGSGESVWDIKEKLGYFTPAMIDRFRGYHSLENMLISGLHDSIGLYVQPSRAEKQLARKWLDFLGMKDLSQRYFHELSLGQQRLIMCVRAMIKHPPLLILDEPTTGLDDTAATLVVGLVNQIARSTDSCVVFVSHRPEPGLNPQFTYILSPGKEGSTGKVIEASAGMK
ncbi:ATP-binding cassette domain-containing protein [Lentiprolixibacter aurantiacus]|uniref:ATP-binding cassette domain-containing protein n=1 Tax=Lentiprolixibacter aurantiacus TaxID=2993939 RepID=A0AAE3SPD8_9FLAO|nr:ATP-binding cassette domain-containing protein [Lentiprolixibacter aurantiacus]MCX2720584.1 ATP-binding cassette domain-containing protein [Lentiprolixibacter aurantiacus]